MARPEQAKRSCWCGNEQLTPFGAAGLRCVACGTLVPQVFTPGPSAEDEPGDGPRLHWLRTLLAYRLPPARVLDLGGSPDKAKLLRLAGYEVAEGEQPPSSPVDVILLDGALEHWPDPLAILQRTVGFLAPDGLVLVRTTEFPEWETWQELQERGRSFLSRVSEQTQEYSYLFGRRALGALLRRLGFSFCQFEKPVSAAELLAVSSRRALTRGGDPMNAYLAEAPLGPLFRSLFDLTDRADCLARTSDQHAAGAEGARHLIDLVAAQLAVKRTLEEQLAASESDRAARLEVIHKLDGQLALARAESAARLDALHHLHAVLAAWQARRLSNRLRRLPSKVVRLFRGRQAS